MNKVYWCVLVIWQVRIQTEEYRKAEIPITQQHPSYTFCYSRSMCEPKTVSWYISQTFFRFAILLEILLAWMGNLLRGFVVLIKNSQTKCRRLLHPLNISRVPHRSIKIVLQSFSSFRCIPEVKTAKFYHIAKMPEHKTSLHPWLHVMRIQKWHFCLALRS